jgi:hypothetical protein
MKTDPKHIYNPKEFRGNRQTAENDFDRLPNVTWREALTQWIIVLLVGWIGYAAWTIFKNL